MSPAPVKRARSAEQARLGDHRSHDERYARTDEFLSILRGAWGERPYDFNGNDHEVDGAPVSKAPTLLPPDP